MAKSAKWQASSRPICEIDMKVQADLHAVKSKLVIILLLHTCMPIFGKLYLLHSAFMPACRQKIMLAIRISIYKNLFLTLCRSVGKNVLFISNIIQTGLGFVCNFAHFP